LVVRGREGGRERERERERGGREREQEQGLMRSVRQMFDSLISLSLIVSKETYYRVKRDLIV
jgi:hypothetical protein